jgi:type IV pilus assembly protein PilQ
MKALIARFAVLLIGATVVATGLVSTTMVDGLMVAMPILAQAQEAPPPPIATDPPASRVPRVDLEETLPPSMRPGGGPPMSPPVPPADAALSSPALAAKVLKDIEVRRQSGGVQVLLKGDGEFSYTVSKLQGNRLVVDLEDVVNGTKRRSIAVGHPLLKQIRIGTHLQPSRKVRLVFDLARPVPYTVEKLGVELQVALVSPAPMPAGLEDTPADTERLRERASNGRPPVEKAALEKAELDKPVVESPPTERPMTERPMTERPVIERPLIEKPVPRTPVIRGQELPPTKTRTNVSVLEPSEKYSGKRISLDFQDAEISSVLRLIADVSGLNMVVGEGAKAKVTLKLINVPWDQALELILKLNQLGQIREGNIIWIDSLSNIARQKDEAVRAYEATVKAEPLGTRIMYLNYADAPKTLDIIKSNLSTRGEVKVDGRTNALVVKDISENLRKIERLLRDLDRVTPQVQIEARIVQASKAFARGIGVQWGISGIASTNNNGFNGPCCDLPGHNQGPVILNLGRTGAAFSTDATASTFLVNLPSTATGVNIPTSAIGLTIGKFLGTTGTLDLRLSAGESLGLTKIVSAPKIITLDHKPAKIEQGSQVPFQTTSLQGTQTTFVDATLTLNVTPHVIPFAQTIRLEIKATKNSIGAAVSTAGPTIDKKEATTEVLLKDGETTVLGGIFEENRSDTVQGIPWFMRIPFLGWLFKTEGVSLTQTELLVFVTPIILKD